VECRKGRIAAPIREITLVSLILFWPKPATQKIAAQERLARQQIAVRVRNGRTGHPTRVASPYVFLGNAVAEDFRESYRRTNAWSDARVDLAGVVPREVKVWVDFIDRDCRYGGDYKAFRTFDIEGTNLRRMPSYDIDKILATGIVSENHCGIKTEKPTPGVLTIFVIPETFKELWNN